MIWLIRWTEMSEIGKVVSEWDCLSLFWTRSFLYVKIVNELFVDRFVIDKFIDDSNNYKDH